MAALTAASWTVAITRHMIQAKQRIVIGTLTLAATDTYPNDGIPLPTKDKFAMIRYMDSLEIFGVDPTRGTVADYVYRWDKTNNKLFVYEEEGTAAGGPLLEADTAEVPGPRSLDFRATGW